MGTIAFILLAVVVGAFLWVRLWRQRWKEAVTFASLGTSLSPGILFGTIVAFVEFFGGIAMLAGFYAEVAAILFGSEMLLGFLWKITKGKRFSDYSYDLILVALILLLITFGVGFYALFPLY